MVFNNCQVDGQHHQDCWARATQLVFKSLYHAFYFFQSSIEYVSVGANKEQLGAHNGHH